MMRPRRFRSHESLGRELARVRRRVRRACDGSLGLILPSAAAEVKDGAEGGEERDAGDDADCEAGFGAGGEGEGVVVWAGGVEGEVVGGILGWRGGWLEGWGGGCCAGWDGAGDCCAGAGGRGVVAYGWRALSVAFESLHSVLDIEGGCAGELWDAEAV